MSVRFFGLLLQYRVKVNSTKIASKSWLPFFKTSWRRDSVRHRFSIQQDEIQKLICGTGARNSSDVC